MSGSRNGLPLILLLLAVASLGAWWMHAGADGARFHPRGMECQNCHLSGKQTKPEQAGMLTASQEALCGGCHANALKVSHPSGITPKGRIPPEYPLDWKGDLTCTSCHTPHGNSPGLLRGVKRGRDFCLACHERKFFDKMPEQGASLMAGHMNSGVPETSQAMNLDPDSIRCLGCHSQSGDPMGVNVDRRGVLRHSDKSMNHPIGVLYADAMRFGGFRSPSMLSKAITLPGGRVSCISCHEGYSKQHGKLVMQNFRSALCFECHDL